MDGEDTPGDQISEYAMGWSFAGDSAEEVPVQSDVTVKNLANSFGSADLAVIAQGLFAPSEASPSNEAASWVEPSGSPLPQLVPAENTHILEKFEEHGVFGYLREVKMNMRDPPPSVLFGGFFDGLDALLQATQLGAFLKHPDGFQFSSQTFWQSVDSPSHKAEFWNSCVLKSEISPKGRLLPALMSDLCIKLVKIAGHTCSNPRDNCPFANAGGSLNLAKLTWPQHFGVHSNHEHGRLSGKTDIEYTKPSQCTIDQVLLQFRTQQTMCSFCHGGDSQTGQRGKAQTGQRGKKIKTNNLG